MARRSKSSKVPTKQSDEPESGNAENTENQAEDAPENESVGAAQVEAQPESEAEGDLSGTEETEEQTGDEPVSEVLGADPPQDEAEPGPDIMPAQPGSPEAPPPPPDAAASKGSGTFGLILGGLVAGAIGFLVATFAVPDGWPNPSPPPSNDMQEMLAAQDERIEALATELAQIAGMDTPDDVDLEPLRANLSDVETRISQASTAVDQRFAELDERITSLADRLNRLETSAINPASEAGSAAIEAQLEAFRQQLDDVTADAEARIAEAQDRANRIEAEAAEFAETSRQQAALASIEASIDDGTAFAENLEAFENVPDGLVAIAEKGVATLATLQAEFPSAARDALAQTRSVPEDAGATQRFAAFLRRQTNARSLAPREGNDADAILSRAEAALSTGDLERALDELQALPEDAAQAMSGWIAMAETRAEALRAVEQLKNSES